MTGMPTHYRLHDHWSEDGRVLIEVEKFHAIKETPCGYWVVSDYYWRLRDTFPEWIEKNKRWTAKAGGRYLHPSLEAAKLHYSIRKRHELRHVRARLDKCLQINTQWGLINLDDLERDGCVDLGAPDSRLFKIGSPEVFQ